MSKATEVKAEVSSKKDTNFIEFQLKLQSFLIITLEFKFFSMVFSGFFVQNFSRFQLKNKFTVYYQYP
jgi:hypothetical protein